MEKIGILSKTLLSPDHSNKLLVRAAFNEIRELLPFGHGEYDPEWG